MPSNIQNLEVVYEDNHIIAVNKQSSDIVQGDKTGDMPLSDIVKAWIKKKYNKPGNVFLGVVHRIDRPVSGLVLFAKTSKALSRLSDLFRRNDIKKTYLAAVINKPDIDSGVLENYLIKNQKNNTSRIVGSDVNGSKLSKLRYSLIGKSDRYYFLKVEPETGRHHQIRVQLAGINCPIKGDIKYGAPRTNKNASIHLHAYQLTFVHPVAKERIILSAKTPHDPVWDDVKKFV